MSIERFIQDEILAPRLQDYQVLTIAGRRRVRMNHGL
jgi:hypothetical protein